MNGFDWGALFIWVPSWFTSWSFFWTTFLTGTLVGTAGGVLFRILPLGSSIPPCVHYLVLLEGLLVMYSVVHILNPVWYEKLHPWKTSVVC